MALVGFLISIVLAAVSAALYAPSLGRRGAGAAALVCAGLLSVVLFPPIALGLLRTSRARRAGRATEQPAYQYSERM